MRKPLKPRANEIWDTHVYLEESDRKAVENIANREERTITAQIKVFIRQGVALYKAR